MRENLKAVRKAAGLTQQAIADRLNPDTEKLLKAVENLCRNPGANGETIKFLKKWLITFDSECCDILSNFRIQPK